MNQPVGKPAFIVELELHADLVRQIGIAAARDDRSDEEIEFIDARTASTSKFRSKPPYFCRTTRVRFVPTTRINASTSWVVALRSKVHSLPVSRSKNESGPCGSSARSTPD